jgi:hypothetical protein
MALNFETAVDIDLNAFTATQELNAGFQEYGISTIKWTPIVTAKLGGDGYCFPSWKEALKTRSTDLPYQCRTGAGSFLFSDLSKNYIAPDGSVR